MVLQKKGTLSFEYEGRIIKVRYEYWVLLEGGALYPCVNIYDKKGREYRFSRQAERSQWTLLYDKNNWAIEFRKKLAQELEKINEEMTVQAKKYKMPTFSF